MMMNTVGHYSPGSSVASSTDSAGLPKSRIKCSKTTIAVGGRKFDSATDALQAYLQQYDGTVENNPGLTASDSDLSKTGQRTLTSSQKLTALLSGSGTGKTGQSASKSSSLTTSNGHSSWPPKDIPPAGRDLGLKPEAGKGLSGSGLVLGSNGICVAGTTEDVEKLLTSEVSPKLQEEVTDTLREVKLRRLLKQAALKSQSQTKTGLQQEVESALLRSAQLLEKVTKEDLPSTKPAISDISSVPTDVLLNDSLSSLDSSEFQNKPTGHVYSYHTHRPPRSSLNHSLSQPVHAPVSYPTQRQPRDRRRRASIESLLPPPHQLAPRNKHSSSSSSASISNQSDPTDIIHRLRSRSASPGLRNASTRYRAPDWVEQLDQSVRKSVPSWVGEINPSEVSDSLWTSDDLLEDKNNRRHNKVPSWVGEVENSDIVTDPHYHNTRPIIPIISTPAKLSSMSRLNGLESGGENVNDITSDSRPGLNYSDLATSMLHTPSSNKHVTFTESTARPGENMNKHQPRYSSSPMVEKRSDLRPQPSRVLDSEYNGEAFLRNNILPQTAKLKKSLDSFVNSTENMRRKSVSSNSSDTSLDTLALLTGKTVARTDGSGPSPIPKDSNMVSNSYSPSPTISAVGQASSPVSNGHDQDSSDGLDGDRPWERVVNTFKPPVPVDGEGLGSKGYNMINGLSSDKRHGGTLSGGKQPGSMETLKNMLFKLQAEETSAQGENSLTEDIPESPQNPNADVIPGLQDYDFQQEPGGHSLEKALYHLNRLKTLVKTTATSGKNEADTKTVQASERLELQKEH